MTEALQTLLGWIQAHPHGALGLLLLIAFADSLLIVGAFVPAALPLFAVGALVALGALDLWMAIGFAAAGALAGDALSFWAGHRYRERLFATAFFRKHPELLGNAQRFFDRYGALSVLLARFLGPFRSITPALAAASGMRPWLFLLADLPAAVGWAAAFIMPGVVFGASLGLAAEVAGRLATLLIALVAGLWAVFWLTSLAVAAVRRRGGAWLHRLLDWSRRHRRLSRVGFALIDDELPETPALAVLALLLLLGAGALLYLVGGTGLHRYPSALDATIIQTLQDLHTPWGLALAQRLLQLGSWPVYAPLAVFVLVLLLILRKPRAAAHWVAALAFGAAIALGLYAIPLLPEPFRYFAEQVPSAARGRDFVLATVTYSFLPILLAASGAAHRRTLLYGLSSALLLLVLFAQIYLGVQWPSIAVLLLVFGLGWSTLLGIGYRYHRPERLPVRAMLPLLLLCLALAAGLRWASTQPSTQAALLPLREITLQQWQNQIYRELPAQRQDVAGRPRQPFTIQWAGDLAEIETALRQSGWQTPAPLTPGRTLHWLSSESAVDELPVLPQVHAGNHPVLYLRLPLSDTRQYLIRLWPSQYRLADGRPIWIGNIALQEARSFRRLLRYPVAIDNEPALAPLFATLPIAHRRNLGAIWLLWP